MPNRIFNCCVACLIKHSRGIDRRILPIRIQLVQYRSIKFCEKPTAELLCTTLDKIILAHDVAIAELFVCVSILVCC